jgi:hypothetical protein
MPWESGSAGIPLLMLEVTGNKPEYGRKEDRD